MEPALIDPLGRLHRGQWRLMLLPELWIIVIGVVVLLGWAFDLTTLKSIVASLPSMKPNAAIAVVLAGAALLLLRPISTTSGRILGARLCAVGVTLIGALTLGEYLFDWALGIDQLLFNEARAAVGTSAPGRMGANAAVVFVLAGPAIALIDVEYRRIRPTQFLALAIGAIALVACAGHVFGAGSLTAFGSATRISVQAAAAYLLLAAALLLVRPGVGLMELANSDGPGGQTVRRLLLPSIIVPLLIGWLVRRGEQADLYEPAQTLALTAVAISLYFMALAWSTARVVQRADTQRRLAHAQFEELVESVPDAIIAVDENGVVRLVNRQAETHLGYRREELLGLAIEVLVPDPMRRDHTANRTTYLEAPTTRVMGAGLEPTARRKDGTEFPVDISLSSLDTVDGLLVVASLRDVSDRKRIEQEQARLDEHLRRAQHEEETAALEVQLQQARRLESVGQLAGGIAHDFNNLLGVVISYTGLVSESVRQTVTQRGLNDDDVFTTVLSDLDEITEAAQRAADLTRQLLLFSRREVTRTRVFDLNEVVIGMANLFRRTIGEHIELRTVLSSGVTRIRADRSQIEQVLMNLVVNARDAMPTGGLLSIETAEFEADNEYGRTHDISNGSYVRLSVSDTGQGMPQDVAARAFEPFFTTKPTGSGTGLGLATAYGITKQAGGDIVIYSEPGLGTMIKINLPSTNEPASDQRRDEPKRVLEPAGETILLVEDEQGLRESTRRILDGSGFTVLTAANADEAVEVAARHDVAIDILLTDVVMPGRSGLELSNEVARLHPRIKILFMSGYSHDAMAHQGLLEKDTNLIEKPFSSDRLVNAILTLLHEF